MIGVFDLDGDAGFADGKNRFLMKDAGPHVGQLAQFAVGYSFDWLRVFDNPGVGHEKTGDVGPIFIKSGFYPAGDNRPGYIGPAAGEGLNLSVRQGTVKPGDNGTGMPRQTGRDLPLGPFRVVFALGSEEYYFCGIHEIVTQKFGEQQTVEIFPPAGDIISRSAGGNFRFDFFQALSNFQGKPQVAGDFMVTAGDDGKEIVKRDPLLDIGVALIKKVGYFVVLRVFFARSGVDDIFALLIRGDNGAYLSKLFGRGQRGSSEFGYFDYS